MPNSGSSRKTSLQNPLTIRLIASSFEMIPPPGLLSDAPLPPPVAREFRAAWVATVENIDWPSQRGLLPHQQQRELVHILDSAVERNLNAIILQVRPSADALYASRKADFERDLDYLHKLHEVMQRRAGEVKAPDLVFQEADLSIRVVRDVLVEEFEGAVIDDPKQHERVTKFLQRTAPELADSVELYKAKTPLLEKWKVEDAFTSTLSRRVDLPSGDTLEPDVSFISNERFGTINVIDPHAAATGVVLIFITLAMNALAIWLRYRLRKNIKW